MSDVAKGQRRSGRGRSQARRDVAGARLPSIGALLDRWLSDAPPPRADTGYTSSSAHIPLPAAYVADGERPGEYPFSRGRTEAMYHDGFWVMGQYSGYASPAETHLRFKRLLEAGQTGLSVALDLPTQMGLDSDHPLAIGEVGKVGVPLDTVEDLLVILRGLPLERARQLRTTANAIGPIYAAFVLVALGELGIAPTNFRLMLQNDPLKEYSARGTFIFPPEAAMRFAVDVMEYFASEIPHWEPIEFCGYHIRDAGGNAVQEIAISAANGLAYLDAAAARGVRVADLAPALYLFLSASVDIFEEAAKIRAARRLWARLLHERYGVPGERCGINVFAYTLGGALTAQEPLNNVVRVTCETLGAALGGVQTMATSSYDEALGLPSDAAARLALRTQQIVAHESGATRVVDPLAGSYYVEDLTDRLESEAIRYLLRIEAAGGAVEGLHSGFIVDEIAASAYEHHLEIESGRRAIVGINVHPAQAQDIGEGASPRPDLAAEQIARLEEIRRTRDAERWRSSIERLTLAVRNGDNSIPALMEVVSARATIGEIVDAIAAVVGRHRDHGGPLVAHNSDR